MGRLSLRVWALASVALVGCGKGEPAPSRASDAASTAASSSAAAAPRGRAAPSVAPPTPPLAGACGYDGAYEAVGYACKGEQKQAFPPFMHWTFTLSGTDGPFTESTSAPMPKCSSSEAYKATCAGSPTVLTLAPTGPSTCTPANCMGRSANGAAGGECNKTPAPILWSVVEHSATSLVLTSVEPFKLSTCTANHKSNPLTVWWQKK